MRISVDRKGEEAKMSKISAAHVKHRIVKSNVSKYYDSWLLFFSRFGELTQRLSRAPVLDKYGRARVSSEGVGQIRSGKGVKRGCWTNTVG